MPLLDDDLKAELQSVYLRPVEVPDLDPIIRRGRHRQRRRRAGLGAIAAALVGLAIVASPLNDGAEKIETVTDPAPETTPTSGEPSPVGPTLEDVTIVVLNASGRSGVAGQLTCELEDLGLHMAPAHNSNGGPVETSSVFGLSGYEAAARELANRLGIPLTSAQPELVPEVDAAMRAQVVVVAGADQADRGTTGGSSTSTTAAVGGSPCHP